MKKLNALRILAIVIIAGIGIVSCSQEESNVTANSSYTLSDLQRLQNEFKNIIVTDEYINYIQDVKLMVNQNDSDESLPLDNRVEFKNWVITNLTKTKFASVDEALALFDDLELSSSIYFQRNESFFHELQTLKTAEEFTYVLSVGDTFDPPYPATGMNPCQEACSDAFDAEYIVAQNNRFFAWMRENLSVRILREADKAFWESVKKAHDNFTDCMGNC